MAWKGPKDAINPTEDLYHSAACERIFLNAFVFLKKTRDQTLQENYLCI